MILHHSAISAAPVVCPFKRKIYVFGPKFSVFWPKSVAQIIPFLAQISYFFGPNYCVFGPN